MLQIPKYQTGCKSVKSTISDIAEVLKLINSERLKRKQKTGILFVDFSKAFDTVNRTKLFKELW